MRFSIIKTIAKFEFRQVVWKKAFWLTTLGLPILFGAMSFWTLSAQKKTIEKNFETHRDFLLVDDAEMTRTLPWQRDQAPCRSFALPAVSIERDCFFLSTDIESAKALVTSKKADKFVYLPKTYLKTGNVQLFARENENVFFSGNSDVEGVLAALLRRQLVRQKLNGDEALRVLKPITLETQILANDGTILDATKSFQKRTMRVILPAVFGVLLLASLVITSGYLVQALSIDRESRVVELLLSTIRAEELLFGKLIGLGAAGMLQFVVWLAIIASVGSAALANTSIDLSSLPTWSMLATLPYFLFGYLFLGSLMLATGALGTNAAESQKLSLGWVLFAITPLSLLFDFIQEPNGAFAQFFSWFPFSTPLAMVVRIFVKPESISTFEIIGTIIWLCFCATVALFIGARLFRVGLLAGGKGIRLEDLRWAFSRR